jgi:hypothetical protein
VSGVGRQNKTKAAIFISNFLSSTDDTNFPSTSSAMTTIDDETDDNRCDDNDNDGYERIYV